MDLPWFPHYPGDFHIKTAHLTSAQVGALIRLKGAMWVMPDCALPADIAVLRQITGLPPRGFQEKIAPVLALFSRLDDGRYTIKGLRDLRAQAEAKRAANIVAGRLGGQRKAANLRANSGAFFQPSSRQIPNKNNDAILANATQTQERPPTHTRIQSLVSDIPPILPSASPSKAPPARTLNGALERLKNGMEGN